MQYSGDVAIHWTMPQSIMTFDELSDAVYEDLNGRIVTVSADGASYDVIFECDDWQT